MKTLTLRVDDETYSMLKKAADGERRTISNFIEYAAVQFLTSELYVSDAEMDDTGSDKDLMNSLKKGISEVKSGKYKIVSK